jgi:hypothetical protein
MWICTSKAFLSIVDKAEAPGCLMVRARVKGHIESVFPGAKVKRTPGNDYLFRAEIKREDVAAAVVDYLLALDYPNFKDSVHDHALHGAFNRVWHAMAAIQEIPPYSYSGRAKRQGDLGFAEV